MGWKDDLATSDRKSLEALLARQRRSNRRFRLGTKKYPGGCVTSGGGDEVEEHAMRKPWGKKPRRPQAKQQRTPPGNVKLPSLAPEITYWRRVFGLVGWKIYGIWRPLDGGDDGRTDIQSKCRRAIIYVQPRVAHSGEFRETVCHEVLHVAHYEIHDAIDGLLDEKLGDFLSEALDAAIERLAETHMRIEKRRGDAH